MSQQKTAGELGLTQVWFVLVMVLALTSAVMTSNGLLPMNLASDPPPLPSIPFIVAGAVLACCAAALLAYVLATVPGGIRGLRSAGAVCSITFAAMAVAGACMLAYGGVNVAVFEMFGAGAEYRECVRMVIERAGSVASDSGSAADARATFDSGKIACDRALADAR